MTYSIESQSAANAVRAPLLAAKLIALRRREEIIRKRLGLSAQLYPRELERVHLANARRLEEITHRVGWPGISMVGEKGAAAAWRIAMDAISYPPFQLWCLETLHEAAHNNEALPRHFAFLFDRVRFNQRAPQRYGTILDWDESGHLVPWNLETPGTVNELRAGVGLESIASYVTHMRVQAEYEGDHAPADFHARQAEISAWAQAAGWI